MVIIDSSITNLKILERLAASLAGGIEAKSFRASADAFQLCRERRPDLVAMAGESGEGEAARLIPLLHALPGCAEVPVVVIAPYEDRDCIDRALAAGAADHLLSPVDHHEFRTRIGNLLQLRRQPGAATEEEPGASPEAPQRPALVEAHERLLRVLGAIPALVCATGKDGRYLFVNTVFAAFVGRRAKQLVGWHPVDAHDGPFARRLAQADAGLIAGEVQTGSFEEEFVIDGDRRRVLQTTKTLFHGDDGEDPIVVTVSVDVTEQKQAEQELVAAKEQAELANKSKTEFLANMSHELRTPLNAIIGFSQIMAGEMLGPIATQKYIGYARDVLASAEHLLGIINDILDVSRLEAGQLDLFEETVDPAKAVGDVLLLVEGKARAGDIRLDLRSEGTVPRLIADSRKFKQIVLNLLTNAIKFSHPGGEIKITLRIQGGGVAVSVADRGIGMDPHEVELATSRFGQIASAWSRRHPGTGLGLPLAIGLTELHGGTLTIHSAKGTGTTVTVAFPPERSEAPPAAIAAAGGSSRRL